MIEKNKTIKKEIKTSKHIRVIKNDTFLSQIKKKKIILKIRITKYANFSM